MKPFNLSKFKKIKETKDWAHLIHEEGHSLMIAKAPLSHTQRKQLERLETHAVPEYAEGGEVNASRNLAFNDLPVTSQSDSLALPAEAPEVPEAQAPAAPEEAPPSKAPEAVAPQAAAPVASAPPPAPPAPAVNSDLAQLKNQGLGQQIEAEKALGKTEAGNAAQDVRAIQNYQTQANALPTAAQLVANNKQKENELYQNYANQKLKPSAYWEGPEGHSKVVAGIGILLSSLGQGLGSPMANQALESVNQGIQQEIDRQKNGQEQSHNLWKMNREALGSDIAANLATQNQLATGLQYELQKHAAQAKTQTALQNANIRVAQIQQMKDQNNFKLALLSPTSDGGDPATKISVLGDLQPEKKELIPKALEEAGKAQITASKAPLILDNFFQALDENKGLIGKARSLSPFENYKNPGQQALIGNLTPTVSGITDSVREAEIENLKHNIVPHGVDTEDNKGVQTKLNTLITYLTTKAEGATNSKALGIDLKHYPQTNITREALANYIQQKYPQYAHYVTEQGNSTLSKVAPNELPELNQTRYERKVINGKAYMVPLQTQTAGR